MTQNPISYIFYAKYKNMASTCIIRHDVHVDYQYLQKPCTYPDMVDSFAMSLLRCSDEVCVWNVVGIKHHLQMNSLQLVDDCLMFLNSIKLVKQQWIWSWNTAKPWTLIHHWCMLNQLCIDYQEGLSSKFRYLRKQPIFYIVHKFLLMLQICLEIWHHTVLCL